MIKIEVDYEAYESEPGPLGQYLLRVYRGNGPVVRTVAWRKSPQDTYGSEHLLIAAEVF